MISVADAQQIIAASLPDWGDERCELSLAHRRVLRAALRADRDQPPFDRVMMDGIAFSYASFAAGRRDYVVQGSQGAGQQACTLRTGEHCIEIMTGAMLPGGCDCVVPVEDTDTRDGRTWLRDSACPEVFRFVHRRGSDYRRGDVLLESGASLRSPEIAIAASVGSATLTVARRPRVAVVASGDELVDIGEPVLPFQIRRSNDYAVAAAIASHGFTAPERFHVNDDPAHIEAVVADLLERFDVLVLTGGVSMGKYDYLPGVLKSLNVELGFHRVAQRPGKPMWFGTGTARQAVFALPGNPVSALTCLHRHVLPALRKNLGTEREAQSLVALAEPVEFKPSLTWFLPVKLSADDSQAEWAIPRPTNTSGDFAGLRLSDGFVELPADQRVFPKGYVARYFSW